MGGGGGGVNYSHLHFSGAGGVHFTSACVQETCYHASAGVEVLQPNGSRVAEAAVTR